MPRPSSPLSAKASTRCPSHASRATPNGKHRETRRCDKQRRWSNDAPGLTRGPPSSLAAFAWANPGRLGEAALHRMQQSSPFRRHFVTEPAGQRDPMRVSPAAASVAVTTRFFTSVHQQHPARPQGRAGQFLSSAAMSEASARFRRNCVSPGGWSQLRCNRGGGFRRNCVPPVAHQSCCKTGGGERARTVDLRLAKPALSQLSYTPVPEHRDQGSGIRTAASPAAAFTGPPDQSVLIPDA